jgi:ParB family chromosome partitioning protein
LGKTIRGRRASTTGNESLSARQMVQKFKTELDRMRLLVEKANKTENTLMIATESFYKILQDDNYRTLLRAENIITMPADLMDMINEREQSYD